MRLHVSVLIALLASAVPLLAQQVTKESVPGVTNFARLETTVACGGATTAAALPEIKKMGFASIINVPQPTENDANIEGEATAAKEAGIRFYNVQLTRQAHPTKA